MINVSYLHMLTFDQVVNAPDGLVGEYAFQELFGRWGGKAISIAVLISIFGCINGSILSGSRVYYAMAKDGLFFKRAVQLDPKHHTPRFSLWTQAVWASLLTLSGSYIMAQALHNHVKSHSRLLQKTARFL